MLRLANDQPFFGFTFEGDTFDCGSKEGFIAANVSFALRREDTGPIVRKIIEDMLDR